MKIRINEQWYEVLHGDTVIVKHQGKYHKGQVLNFILSKVVAQFPFGIMSLHSNQIKGLIKNAEEREKCSPKSQETNSPNH